MRPTPWLVLASLTAACGLDFEKFEPNGGGGADASDFDASGGGTVDSTIDAGSSLDGAPDAPSETGTIPSDASLDQDAISGCAATCQGATPVCNPTTHQCSATCTSDAECSTKLPYCSPQTAQCVQCIASSNCAGTTTPICAASQQCAECQVNGDCSGSTPYCSVPDGGAGSCVQCLESSQCPTRRATCTNGKCS